MRFKDRSEAGQLLAERLAEKYKGDDAVIYALPRGGVVPGVEIAKHLGAPLDLLIARKIGHPSNPEYAICAVTEQGQPVCNEQEVAELDPKWLEAQIQKAREESRRRRLLYLAGRSAIPVEGKVAIIVDDGIATGLTIQAAIQDVKARSPAKIVLAVPVLPRDIAKELKEQVDDLVALDIPPFYLGAVGAYYEQFDQVEDEEVIQLLEKL